MGLDGLVGFLTRLSPSTVTRLTTVVTEPREYTTPRGLWTRPELWLLVTAVRLGTVVLARSGTRLSSK